MKQILRVVLFIALLLIQAVFAQETVKVEKLAFQIYGQDHLISLPLPDYWTVDMNVAHKNNFNGFFYIKDKGVNGSPAYIFVNLYGKEAGKSFDQFVTDMVESLRNYQPKYNVEKVLSQKFSTQMNAWNAEIYDVRIKTGTGHYQKIAYMKCENKYYLEIYIDCYEDTNKDNDKYIRDFLECIHDIEYLNIQLKKS